MKGVRNIEKLVIMSGYKQQPLLFWNRLSFSQPGNLFKTDTSTTIFFCKRIVVSHKICMMIILEFSSKT